jgi:hypothetical protein
MLAWRLTRPELRAGAMALLPVHEQVLGYVRTGDTHDMLCLLNLSGQAVTLHAPSGFDSAIDDTPAPFARPLRQGDEITLLPWSAGFFRRAH